MVLAQLRVGAGVPLRAGAPRSSRSSHTMSPTAQPARMRPAAPPTLKTPAFVCRGAAGGPWLCGVPRPGTAPHLGAHLANDDASRLDGLAAKHLDATALGDGVAAVLGRARSLLLGVLHHQRAPRDNRRHGHSRAPRGHQRRAAQGRPRCCQHSRCLLGALRRESSCTAWTRKAPSGGINLHRLRNAATASSKIMPGRSRATSTSRSSAGGLLLAGTHARPALQQRSAQVTPQGSCAALGGSCSAVAAKEELRWRPTARPPPSWAAAARAWRPAPGPRAPRAPSCLGRARSPRGPRLREVQGERKEPRLNRGHRSTNGPHGSTAPHAAALTGGPLDDLAVCVKLAPVAAAIESAAVGVPAHEARPAATPHAAGCVIATACACDTTPAVRSSVAHMWVQRALILCSVPSGSLRSSTSTAAASSHRTPARPLAALVRPSLCSQIAPKTPARPRLPLFERRSPVGSDLESALLHHRALACAGTSRPRCRWRFNTTAPSG